MRDEREKKAFREIQGARIARWIRDSEVGWIFYGPGGGAFHLLADEAARLEAEGQGLIEKCLVTGFVTAPSKRFALAVFVAFWIAASTIFPAVVIPGVILASFVVAIAPVAAAAIGNDIGYELALRRWRRATAMRLARTGRGGVPEAVAARHRRHNIFLYICVGAAVVYFVRLVWMILAKVESVSFGPVEIAIGAVVVLTAYAARLVDRTHRRRKWLD